MDEIDPPSDVTLQLITPDDVYYSNLSDVQQGLLFHAVCLQLIADPLYSTIHPREGSGSQNVVMSCDDNVSDTGMLITGWGSKTWKTPVERSHLESYIDSVPYDSWWIDRQEVVRGFYTELINRYEGYGGYWPVTSFWGDWAAIWSGVRKEDLPDPDSHKPSDYCVQAIHHSYPNQVYSVAGNSAVAKEGYCA